MDSASTPWQKSPHKKINLGVPMPALSRAFAALSLFACATLAPLLSAQADEALVQRGAYLAAIMDCAGCHTPHGPQGPDMTQALHGANYGFQLPGLGTFVPPNLTSDKATGLGDWTAEQIGTAITTGVRPDGRILAPIMPWMSYAAITPEDLAALVAFLQSVPAASYDAPGPWGPSEKPTLPYLGMVMP